MVDLYNDDNDKNTQEGTDERSNVTIFKARHVAPPWQCPSARDVERLWNQTCMVEELVLRITTTTMTNRDAFSQASLEDLRKHFDQAVHERRFCNLDIAHMWEHDPRWRQFVNDTFAEQKNNRSSEEKNTQRRSSNNKK